MRMSETIVIAIRHFGRYKEGQSLFFERYNKSFDRYQKSNHFPSKNVTGCQ